MYFTYYTNQVYVIVDHCLRVIKVTRELSRALKLMAGQVDIVRFHIIVLIY